MNYIWYEQRVNALRLNIESNHMDQRDALSELSMTEEHFAYSEFGDDEKITLRCPWSEHCECAWQIEGHIEFKLVRVVQE